ncbi:MAG: hypothetical protein WCC65_05030 [Pseudonocardiaceae bacterium]
MTCSPAEAAGRLGAYRGQRAAQRELGVAGRGELAVMSARSRDDRLSAPVAALVGLLSVAAGLGVGHLVAGLVSPTASPFLAVGSTAIDLTPIGLKDFAVRSFGTYDRTVLLMGMAVVIAVVGVATGLVSRRSRVPGLMAALGDTDRARRPRLVGAAPGA